MQNVYSHFLSSKQIMAYLDCQDKKFKYLVCVLSGIICESTLFGKILITVLKSKNQKLKFIMLTVGKQQLAVHHCIYCIIFPNGFINCFHLTIKIFIYVCNSYNVVSLDFPHCLRNYSRLGSSHFLSS